MKRRAKGYLLCLSNRGYKASRLPRRLYRQLPDPEAERHGLVRVIDTARCSGRARGFGGTPGGPP